MPLLPLLALLLCNLFWSGAYSVSKLLLENYHPAEVSFLRYLIGAVPLIVYCGLRRTPEGNTLFVAWFRDRRRLDLRIVAVGLLAFFVTPFCQMTGLDRSRAVDSALMIAMEPLVTVLMACVILREKLRARQAVAFLFAIAGALVLSEVTFEKLASFTDARLVGNAIFLISTLSEGAYSAITKPVLERRSPVVFLTGALTIGVAALFFYNIALYGPERAAGLAPLFARAELRGHSYINAWELGAFAFLGLGCTTFAYLCWTRILKDVPISLMALTLYVQPVLGTVWGHLWIGETLTLSTFVGAALILGAVALGSKPRGADAA